MQLTVSASASPEQTLSLKTDGQPIEYFGFLITLTDLTPVPELDKQIDPNSYQATLVVSNKN